MKTLNAQKKIIATVTTAFALISGAFADSNASHSATLLKAQNAMSRISGFTIESGDEKAPLELAKEGENSTSMMFEVDPSVAKYLLGDSYPSVTRPELTVGTDEEPTPGAKPKAPPMFLPQVGFGTGYPYLNAFAGFATKYFVADVTFSGGYNPDAAKWGLPKYEDELDRNYNPTGKQVQNGHHSPGVSSLSYALRLKMIGGRVEAGVRYVDFLLKDEGGKTRSEYRDQFKKWGYDVKVILAQFENAGQSEATLKVFLLFTGLKANSPTPNFIRLGLHWDINSMSNK